MKKHIIIAKIIFCLITALSLASNFIPWDETPLEQTIYALPLGIGFLIQLPFFSIIATWFGGSTASANYELLWTIIPFIAGILYASIYFLIVLSLKKLGVLQSQKGDHSK